MEKKLRVAMIIQAYHPLIGGAEKQLKTIAPLLKARGVEVVILTRRYAGLSGFEMVDGIPVHRLPIPGPMPLASMVFTISGILLLRRIRPNVIHAHELLSPTTTAVGAKLLFGYPVVAKVLGGGRKGDISKLKRNPVSALRVNTILKMVDRFISVSREIGLELSESGIPHGKLVSIPNGVNTVRFHPADTEEKMRLGKDLNLPAGVRFIYTGRLEEEKNVSMLVSIWSRIRSIHPNAYLVIIGGGSEEGAIISAASEGVVLLGEKADVSLYLRACDVFVLPSKREGLSNSLLEGMACGLPSIVTSVGGNTDLVSEGVNGVLVPSEDPKALETAILGFLYNPSRITRMGQKAREFVLENFQIEKTIDRLVNLYKGISRD